MHSDEEGFAGQNGGACPHAKTCGQVGCQRNEGKQSWHEDLETTQNQNETRKISNADVFSPKELLGFKIS